MFGGRTPTPLSRSSLPVYSLVVPYVGVYVPSKELNGGLETRDSGHD